MVERRSSVCGVKPRGVRVTVATSLYSRRGRLVVCQWLRCVSSLRVRLSVRLSVCHYVAPLFAV